MRHGIRHGKGVYISANGDKFEGQYENGIKTGAGVYNFKNGSRLEGKFDQGSIVVGSFTFANGDSYQGEFKNDEFDGVGKWTSGDGAEIYEGSFIRGLRHGKGKLTIGTKDQFEGDFFEDMMHGQGLYTFANGDSFVGCFKAGKFEGPGEYTFAMQQKVIAVRVVVRHYPFLVSHISCVGRIQKRSFSSGHLDAGEVVVWAPAKLFHDTLLNITCTYHGSLYCRQKYNNHTWKLVLAHLQSSGCR